MTSTTIASTELAEPAAQTAPDAGLTANRPVLGVLFVAVATLLFATNDTANKLLVTDYNVPLVAAIRYIVHALLMLALLGPSKGREMVATTRTSLVIVRSLCLVVATFFAGLALQRMPVAETVSIIYLSPIIVVLLARPLLGETIGAVGWIAATAGFAGVLLIVRPGSGLDLLGVGYVLCNVVVTVAYFLLSRVLASTEKTLALLFYSALTGAICFGIALPWTLYGQTPTLLQGALFLSMGVTAGLGHYCFTAAYRFAPASVLAPINYLHLLWAGVLGWLVFGHVPEALTILGMAIVAAAGVAVVLRAALEADLNLTEMTTLNVPTIKLNNGIDIPTLGFGVFQTPPDETAIAVEEALRVGYRHIDTAAGYANERGVGEGIRRSRSRREDVFVETKIWITDYGYDETLHGFEKSARKLGLEQIDLLILHQPLTADFDRTRGAYRALETLLADGKVRAIGISNFMQEDIEALMGSAKVVPAVNQIELHPYFQQPEVQRLNRHYGILTQAWAPLGGITFYRPGFAKSTLEEPVILAMGDKYGKSAAQIMLRWGVQEGRSVIPKSVKPARIAGNFAVFDFELAAEELAAIDALDTGVRGGPVPGSITPQTFKREIPEA